MSGPDDVAFDLGVVMVNMRESVIPIEEAARAMRAELIEKQGWSQQSADAMACEWYVLVMKTIQAAATGRNVSEGSTED